MTMAHRHLRVRALVGWILAALAAGVLGAAAETRYVSPAGLHIAPFTNWPGAATNIQSALDACAAEDRVVVSNGTYALLTTVRVTNGVALASLNGRETVVLDGGALATTQDVVFLMFGSLDGFTISNAPRHGVKSEHGAIFNSLITHARSNGIDSYTTPRVVTNSVLVVSNTLVRGSGGVGIFTCAVDTRIHGCEITGSGDAGVSLRQNDTTGAIQVPRVSNFLIRASTVSSNRNSGIALAFWNYAAELPAVPVLVEDCVIEDNVGERGGGVADSGGSGTDRSSGVRVSGCAIRRNVASVDGGGVYFALNRDPVVEASFLEDNVAARYGGGFFAGSGGSGAMRNCLVRGNVADNGGGALYGALHNDTVVGNVARVRGGGTGGVAARNCIVFYNEAPLSSNDYNSSFAYSCIAPLATGPGNHAGPPGFAGFRNWRLVAGSPCVDTASPFFPAGDYDLDGDPRVWGAGVDSGADEFYPASLRGPLAVEVLAGADRAVVGAPVAFRCDVAGKPATYRWDFSDGFSVADTPFVDRTFSTAGVYVATVVATNADGAASNSVSVVIFPGYTNYVSPAGAHVAPFTNWLAAATNIQEAIAANIPGGVVLVAAGTYDSGGVAWNGALTNRIAITNVLDVVSAAGPNNTLIVGQGPWGDAAVRCAYVAAGARLVGFTLTNGHTRAAGDPDLDQSGAGAWCEPGATLRDCVVRDNSAFQAGGGLRGGSAQDSTLRDNDALYGGGADGAALAECVLAGNVAAQEGGGAWGGSLTNVLLVDNHAVRGGGAAEAALAHSTVAHNHASGSGGGAYRSVAVNSILYLNTAGDAWSNFFNTVCRYCGTAPDPQSTGNVVGDPGFVDAAAGLFSLRADSPALDAAEASPLAVDLAGMPRPVAGAPGAEPRSDLGAYERTGIHYAAPEGGHVWPFLSWADAARDLQSAVDAADPLDEVFASNGVYATGGRASSGALTNRVVIDKAVRVTALHGAAATAIEGRGPVGEAAVRGVELGAGAALVGFTVRAGATRADGDPALDQSGGGIWADPSAVASNCVIVSNAANAAGGGVFGGRLVNSFLSANVATQGGGAAFAAVEFCTLAGNHAADGGGAYAATGRCSIVYFNTASGAGANVAGGAWDTCCVVPDPGGPGHLTNDPLFLAVGDYRLAPDSPCIDAAPGAAPFPAQDLAGTPRPLDGDANGSALPDIGAQEHLHALADSDGDGMPDDWEIANGLAPLAHDAAEDPDGDGLPNLQEHQNDTDPHRADTDGDAQPDGAEVLAGMDPRDPDSFFAIQQMSVGAAGQVFSWPGRTNRLYTVLATDDLTGGMTNHPDFVERPGADGAMAFTNAAPGRINVFGVRVRQAP